MPDWYSKLILLIRFTMWMVKSMEWGAMPHEWVTVKLPDS